MTLGVIVGCPGLPGLLWWFLLVGGVVHVLGAGVVAVTVWEMAQDRARRSREE